MTKQITGNEDVIDSRDVIARIEELEDQLQTTHQEETEAGQTNLDFEEWLEAMQKDASPAHAHELNAEREEYQALKSLADEAQSSPDWEYGETLINRDYFVQYIEELIEDCYALPEGFNSGEWPWRHMKLDYESAASEAEQDYFTVDLFGQEFLIRA